MKLLAILEMNVRITDLDKAIPHDKLTMTN